MNFGNLLVGFTSSCINGVVLLVVLLIKDYIVDRWRWFPWLYPGPPPTPEPSGPASQDPRSAAGPPIPNETIDLLVSRTVEEVKACLGRAANDEALEAFANRVAEKVASRRRPGVRSASGRVNLILHADE